MALPKLTRLKLKVVEARWGRARYASGKFWRRFPKRTGRSYSTVQTIVYRLEAEKALKRVRKIIEPGGTRCSFR